MVNPQKLVPAEMPSVGAQVGDPGASGTPRAQLTGHTCRARTRRGKGGRTGQHEVEERQVGDAGVRSERHLPTFKTTFKSNVSARAL